MTTTSFYLFYAWLRMLDSRANALF